MTSDLAIRTGLPGRLLSNGYILPDDLTFDEWRNVLALTEHIAEASPWWLGDAIVYGERRFPDRHAQALPTPEDDVSGARQSRMKSAAWVSAKFPTVTRVTELSWTHHRVVAEMPTVEARRLLMAAINPSIEGKPVLSTRELIDLRDRRKRELEGRAATLDGELIETAALAWVPVLEDLSPDAREWVTSRAPQGSKRSTWIAAALSTLVWVGDDANFLPGRWRP